MNYKQSLKAGITLGSIMIGSLASASGFEKSIPWGGQTSGVAGIGTSYMQGSQALFFNPAGLVSDKAGAQDVTLNLSPTMPQFKESVDTNGDQVTSRSTTLVPFSLIYGNTVNDKIGFGVGGYISGGDVADFQNLPFNVKGGPESMVNLITSEVSAGVGYKIMDGLKVGAAYRVVSVKAGLDVLSAAGGGAAIIESQNTNLTDTQYNGFKLGAQYKVNDKWDLGLTYRSETIFRAQGTQVNTQMTQAGSQSSAATGVTVGTELPPAWTLGSTYLVADNWKLFGEYVFTQYSKVTNLSINTAAGGVGALQLNFKDQHNVRVAAEYKGFSWPIRFGYIFTSQVTDSNHTIAGLTPPGTAHTLTLGTGQAFDIGGQSFRADGGLEYTMASGSSSGGAYPAGANPQPIYTNGSNTVSELGLHLGAAYVF